MSTPLFGLPAPISLRFRSRHAHKTVAAYIEEKLTQLGWVGSAVPFGATPLTFKEVVPDENGVAVAANTVSITAGDLSEDALAELGGGLWEVVLPIFIDVYGDSASIAQSIAEDVREQLTRGMVIPMFDWSDVQAPALDGGYIEFEGVVGPERPQASAVSQDFRKFWRVVKVEAHLYYEGTG